MKIFSRAAQAVGSPSIGEPTARMLHAAVLSDLLFPVRHAPQPGGGGDVREGTGFENVGTQPTAADLLAGMIDLDLHLTESFFALGDGADAVVAQCQSNAGETRDRGINRIDRPVSDTGILNHLAAALFEPNR